MRHQKLHLVGQDAAVAQNEVFPQAGNIRRVEQGHVGLLGGAAAFAVVAGAAGGDDVHPVVAAVLGEGDDVLACEFGFVVLAAAVGADVAVAGKELAIGEARLEIKGVDIGNALGADDAAVFAERDHARYRYAAAGERVLALLLANGPVAVTETKQQMLSHAVGGQEAGDRCWTPVVAAHAAKRQTREAAEGLASFAEKRAARWQA